jgi:hypothetical protein
MATTGSDMKKAAYILLLICGVSYAQVTEAELIGTWKTSKVTKKPDNPYYRNIVDSFKSAKFVLGADHVFDLSTTQNSQDFASLRQIVKKRRWKFDEKTQVIKIGTPGDNFSAMKIKVRKESDQIFFTPDERGIELQIEKLEMR